MRMPLRKMFRLALCGWLGLAGLCLLAAQSRAAAPIEKALPGSTLALLKVNSASAFRDAISQSQMGQLWADPSMKPVKEDLSAKLDDASKQLKEAIGITIGDLIQLPQGAAALAIVGTDAGKVPIALIISADVGDKSKVMQDTLLKATKLAEEKGDAKATTETFNNLTLHVLRSTKDEEKDNPPIIWTNQGSVYQFSTDLEALKDLVSHSDGRDDSLADNESFIQVKKKLGEDAQFLWFIDVTQGIKLFTKALAGGGGGGGGNAQQVEAMLQVTGINGLKAIAGSSTFNSGHYDMLNKMFILAPGPSQGVLKIFSMPQTNLRPEPWVPASAASYETISWDLDSAYTAINDLANMFNPGFLNLLEQQLAGPNGGEPLSFQKDIFGPIGDRITVISDFKKQPKNKDDDSQRTLFALALEDSKAFRNTLNKLIALTKANPKKRDFQGTTIYDFDISNMVPPGGPPNMQIKGLVSVAVAKDTCFVSTEPTLLEQVLRAGGPRLADSPDFQAVAKELPEQTSTLSYAKPEEAIRQLYDMLKSGQFQKALEQAAMAGGPDVPKLGDLFDMNKLPEFSVISKYLSQSGGYGVMSEDGFLTTSFSLRKVNP